MTFDEWWKSNFGDTPLEEGNGGIVAIRPWAAAVAAERERCAKIADIHGECATDRRAHRAFAVVAAAIREDESCRTK